MSEHYGSVVWRHAKTLEDADIVRRLRNAGSSWFGDSNYITHEEQQVWWEANKGDIQCIIVGEPPVGYGMIRRRDSRLWVSLAVDEKARGRGWGKAIYELLVQVAGNVPIYAAIRNDNIASRKAAERAGYKIVAIDPPGVAPERRRDWLVMRYPGVQEC